MKKLEHRDVVLFDNSDQLQEYAELSGDTSISYNHPTVNDTPVEECEIFGEFPRIHSKHWSFCVLDNHSNFDIKQTALTRLISYHEYKRIYGDKNHCLLTPDAN